MTYGETLLDAEACVAVLLCCCLLFFFCGAEVKKFCHGNWDLTQHSVLEQILVVLATIVYFINVYDKAVDKKIMCFGKILVGFYSASLKSTKYGINNRKNKQEKTITAKQGKYL